MQENLPQREILVFCYPSFYTIVQMLKGTDSVSWFIYLFLQNLER